MNPNRFSVLINEASIRYNSVELISEDGISRIKFEFDSVGPCVINVKRKNIIT